MTKKEIISKCEKEIEFCEKTIKSRRETDNIRNHFIGRKEAISELLEDIKKLNIEKNAQDKVCTTFFSNQNITSATKCMFCGKERFEHTNRS